MVWLYCYGCTAMVALLWLQYHLPCTFLTHSSLSFLLHFFPLLTPFASPLNHSYPTTIGNLLISPSLSFPLSSSSLSPFQNITDIEGYFKQELNISSVTTHIFPTRLPLEGLEALWVSKRGTSFPVVIRLFNLKHLALNFTSHYSVRRRTVCTLVAAVYCSRVTACMCSRNDCM